MFHRISQAFHKVCNSAYLQEFADINMLRSICKSYLSSDGVFGNWITHGYERPVRLRCVGWLVEMFVHHNGAKKPWFAQSLASIGLERPILFLSGAGPIFAFSRLQRVFCAIAAL